MKKNLSKITVFALSLAIGLGFVWLLKASIGSGNNCQEDQNISTAEIETIKVKKTNGEIEVKFKEFVWTTNGLVADFEVVNNAAQIAYFRAYPQTSNDNRFYSLASKKVDGKKIEESRCGTGLTGFELKSGESQTFSVYVSELSYYWESGKSMQVGFYFGKGIIKEYKIYWSENLPITDSIARQLLMEQNRIAF